MKKKIAYISTLAAISVGCFFIGRNTASTEVSTVDNTVNTVNEQDSDLLINVADIVDWNTGGDELAITLKNDYEYYATKSQNVYTPKFKDYVGFNEIKEINETEDTYEITTKDGNIYTVDK